MTCPTNPEHGRVYDLDTRWYCPHHGHDRDHTRNLFTEDEVMAGHIRPSVATSKPKRTRRGR